MATDEDGYPCAPRQITPAAWLYEQKQGVVIVQDVYGRTGSVTIPWRKVCAAVDRHRKIKQTTR